MRARMAVAGFGDEFRVEREGRGISNGKVDRHDGKSLGRWHLQGPDRIFLRGL